MATVSAPYASGTITSVSGTTVALSGGAVAGWVGRCIRINSGAGAGQIRKITAFTSATQITVDYAWNLSPFSALGFSEVEPVSGSGFGISHLIADIVDATTVIADTGTLSYRFVGASTFSGGAFLYAANSRIELPSASIAAGSPTTDATRCCFRFGDIDQFGNVYNGCFLTDSSAAPSGFGTGSAAARDPDFHFYAGMIRCTGSAPFWRFHSDAGLTCRMIGINVDGNLGGRIIGSQTILKDWIVTSNTSASGPFNPKAPIGAISNIKSAKGLQGIYQYWPDSLTVEAEGIITDSTVTKLARFANTTTTGKMFTIKDFSVATLQGMTLLYTNSTGTYANTFRLSQYLNAAYVNAAGAAITDSTRFVVRDNVPANVYDAAVTTGSIPRQTLRYRDMTIQAIGDYSWANAGGTTYAPYAVAAISYLYQPASIPLPLATSQSVNLVGLVDANISQTNRATVDAYATIDNLDKLYDRAKAWTVDNLSAANPSFGAQLATGSGNTLNLGAFNLTIDAAAASPFAVAGSTITIKASALANGSRFQALTTTGTVTLAGGATISVSKYTDTTGVNVGVSVTGIVSGSRIQLYNVTDAAEVANLVPGTSYFQYLPYTADKSFRLRVAHHGGVTCYDEFEASGTFGANGISFTAAQVPCTVYNANGIDGSTVTEFTADYPTIHADIADPDGVTSVQRLYAWYHYTITSADGIRYFFGAMDAPDTANYIVVTALANLKLDNVNASPVVITGGYLSRDDGATVIAATSGSIQMDPSKAYIAGATGITASLARIEPNTGLIPALL